MLSCVCICVVVTLKDRYCGSAGYLLAPSNNRPTCWYYNFWGLGSWSSKIPFPELTHFLCYMGSKWAIYIRRKPWNVPGKHRTKWSSLISHCRAAKDLRPRQPATCLKLMDWLYKALLCQRLPLVVKWKKCRTVLIKCTIKSSSQKMFTHFTKNKVPMYSTCLTGFAHNVLTSDTKVINCHTFQLLLVPNVSSLVKFNNINKFKLCSGT